MIKRLNLVKITIIIIILVIVHFAVGFFISPAITGFVITQLNKYTAAKISLDRAELWPLTLNVKLTNLKIFDPDDTSKRIIDVPNASFRLSVPGLLSKRIVISHAVLNNPEISLEGRNDGSFNIQDIVKREERKPIGIEVAKHKDVFGRIYNIIKGNFSKKQAAANAQKRKEQERVTKTVEKLPQGKLVRFKTAKYSLEIVDLDFNNATISFKSAEGSSMEIREAKIQLRDFGVSPELGMKIGSFMVNAILLKDKVELGGVSVKGVNRYINYEPHLNLDVQLKKVNIKPLEFIYQDSLPVKVEKGILDLASKTAISPGSLNSRNELHLREYALLPKDNFTVVPGFMPMNVVCDALNELNAIDLNFDITGTPEEPEFKGFKESLNKLIKPVLNKIGERIKGQGFKILEDKLKKKTKSDSPQTETPGGEDSKTVNPVDMLESIFGGKEKTK